jgi:hypothetical protein
MASVDQCILTIRDQSERAAFKLLFDSLLSELAELKTDSIINAPVLSTGSTAEQVATTAFQYRIDGVPYTKAAVTAGTALTSVATHTVAANKFGGFAAQIDAAGTISFIEAGDVQSYASEALAEAAARALPAAAGNVIFGWFVVGADGGIWTAVTDDLTPASDLTSVTYYSASAAHFLTR